MGNFDCYPKTIKSSLISKEIAAIFKIPTVTPGAINLHVTSCHKLVRTFKGGEIRDTKILNLSRNVVSMQVFVNVSRFSPCAINLARNKNICCGLKKSVAKSRALVYLEQQILALLLVFHQTHNLSRNKCRHIRSTPSKSTNQRAAFRIVRRPKKPKSNFLKLLSFCKLNLFLFCKVRALLITMNS